MGIIGVINEAIAVRETLDYVRYVKWFHDRFSTETGRSMG